MRNSVKFGAAAALCIVAASAIAQTPASYVPLPLTTRALMLDVVAELPNPIWEKSYATELTDDDWAALKKSASALAAIEARDQTALQLAGDTLVEDCMGCHVAFDPTAR
jgi:hypothetical protein